MAAAPAAAVVVTENSKNSPDPAIVWLGALCFFLSAIEFMIPKPLPFLRLGLANLPVMLAAYLLPLQSYILLVAIKVLGQGLIGGTLFSYIFVFSTAGTLASALAMRLYARIPQKYASFVGMSALGAFTSNVVQLLFARFWIFGESAWYIAPPFLAVGLVTGTLLGLFANRFAESSRWFADLRDGKLKMTVGADNGTGESKGTNPKAGLRFSLGATLTAALLFSPSLTLKALICLTALILLLVDRARIRPLSILVMSGGIVVFNLLVPVGKVLWDPFGLLVTEGALKAGIEKALLIEGMIFLSRWMLKYGLNLPGKAGVLISSAFQAFGHLVSGKKRIDPRNLIQSIDSVMYEPFQGLR